MEEIKPCPVCSTKDSISELSSGAFYKIKCPRCGIFNITYQVTSNYYFNEEVVKGSLLSYWIRNHQQIKPIMLDMDKVKDILENSKLPKPNEQANNLLLWIGDNVGKPDGLVSETPNNLTSIIGAIDESNVLYVMDYLKEQGYITHNVAEIQMAFKGWDKYDELKRTSINSRLVFMAMKYGNSILDRIYTTVIKEAVKETEFDIRRLDEDPRAGLIDDKLRVEIRRSKFLIADLSDNNNGAYWEAGYAEGLGMHVIYICEKKIFDDRTKSTHFDTNHHLTVPWEDTEEGLKEFADKLKATIRATFPLDAKMED